MNFIKWNTGAYDAAAAAALAKELGVSSLAAKVLCARGLTEAQAARTFLDISPAALSDPMLLKDMDRAVERIERALEEGEKIAVYGDYDVDGITSTYILTDYLMSLGADCIYHIPDRIDEGYGVNIGSVERLRDAGVSLIVTVDTGVTAVEEAARARELGVDLVICDHHECKDTLPDACAVVNPHRPDCGYPEKNLAGVGVAFKLICALEGELVSQYLPFVCIGTIADVMPLTGENRVIAAQGLPGIATSGNPGLRALIRAAGAEGKEMTAGIVGFQLAPRINAAGRMSSASRVVELFMMQDAAAADALAKELCELNRQRQQIENEILKQAVDQAEQSFDPARDHALVLAGEGWHHGVVGIVASRISERYRCPAVLISIDGEQGKGSGRSVSGVNLFQALSACGGYLDKFGGHALAAGLTIAPGQIPAFRRALSDAVAEEMAAYQPALRVDFAAEPGELTLGEVRSLRVLEPYGMGNPQPVLRLNRVRAAEIVPIGNGKHLRLTLERGGKFGCVYFGKTERDLAFVAGDLVDVAFTPDINDFRGESVQLLIKDIRPAEPEFHALYQDDRRYRAFRSGVSLSGEDAARIRVEYADLGAVWRVLSRRAGVETPTCPQALAAEISAAAKREITAAKLLIALDIFQELGLLTYSPGARLSVTLCGEIQKANLEHSATARRMGCTARPAGGPKGN